MTIGPDLNSLANNVAFSCVSGLPDICTAAQTSPGGGYVSPIDGVIVRWRVKESGSTGHPINLRILRPGAGPGTYAGAGTSETQLTDSGTGPPFQEFATRMPIRAGDLVGLDAPYGQINVASAVPGATISRFEPTLPNGGGGSAPSSPVGNALLLLNADVEPDCDSDGFGDETQDTDIASCTPDTSPPETTITKGPNKKTKKKTATFEFSGADARVVAGFECSLDGGAFAACTSPHTVKVKKGKHTLSVRAVDDSTNRDVSAATYSWKVKKKRKKQ